MRSERLLMEQLDYNLLFRWFVGLGMDDPVWDATVFTKNRERLLRGDIAQAFFERGPWRRPEPRQLLSDEHFTVDGTLIDAWASLKSFKRKGRRPPRRRTIPGNPTVNFHGERRSNATHASTTDPQALLISQGRRPRSQALLPGPRADGEPPRPGRRRLRDVRPLAMAEREAALAMARSLRPAGHRRAPTKAMTPATSSRRSARSR